MIATNRISFEFASSSEPVDGRCGSGKSTLAMALSRAVHIVSGHIFIDDVNIATIHTAEFGSGLSIIPQDVIPFNVIQYEKNLDSCNHCGDLDLWKSLEMAQPHSQNETIVSMADIIVVVNGSNGLPAEKKKQLLCLARVALRSWVLDEATNSSNASINLALKGTEKHFVVVIPNRCRIGAVGENKNNYLH